MSAKTLNITTFLKRVDMTKKDVAEEIGCSVGTLTKAEKEGPTEELTMKLARVAVRVLGPEETQKLTGLEVKRKGRPGVPLDKDALKTLMTVREHLSLAKVGAALGCSPTKIYRMEHQLMGVNPKEVKKLHTIAAKL
jgi:DNA-binding XRE family transcriptional regulator